MFANLKKKLNVDAGVVSDSQPSSPVLSAATSAGSSPVAAMLPARLVTQSVRGSNDASVAKHADDVRVAPVFNSPMSATRISKPAEEAEVTTAAVSAPTLSLPSTTRSLASDLQSVATGGNEVFPLVGHRKDAEDRQIEVSSIDQGASASEQTTSQQHALPDATLSTSAATPHRPGERGRLLELLNKKSDQLRALEFKTEEQAAVIRDRDSTVERLEDKLRAQQAALADTESRLRAEHEEQCRLVRAEYEAELRRVEDTFREQLAQADRQCAETVLATEERCRAQAAGDLLRASQELSLCKEELHRRDREANEIRALVNETASKASVHTTELAARAELVMQLQAEKQSLVDTNETLTSELCAVREKLKVLHMQVNTLETELVKKNEQIGALEKLTGELQSVRNRLERDLRAVQDGSSHIGLSGAKDADAEIASHKKITDLEGVVREAEKRERALSNLLQEKDVALENSHRQLETARVEWASRESNFSSRLNEMADEQRAHKKAFDHERTVLLGKIAGLESSHDESLERQIEGERRLSESEQELAAARRAAAEREEDVQRLEANAEAAAGAQTRLASEVNRLQAEVHSKDNELQRISRECQEKQQALDRLQRECDDARKQNDELRRRLADLAESNAGDASRVLADHARQLDERDAELRRLTDELQRLTDELQRLEAAAEAADRAAAAASDELQRRSAELSELREAVRLADSRSAELEAARQSARDLEEQLAEKGKALKLQQQHVNDLKKALQKNLKTAAASPLPPAAPASSTSSASAASVEQPLQQQQQRLPSPLLSDHRHRSPTQTLRDGTAGGGRDAASGSDSESLPGATWPTVPTGVGDQSRPIGAATPIACLPAGSAADASPSTRRVDLALAGGSASQQFAGPSPLPASGAAAGAGTTSDDLDSWNLCSATGTAEHAAVFSDVNFKYLRNVVLKFLVCREAEAVQLVKAITVLLHLSPQEEKLLKDTLEYRMSWFGPRPQLRAK